VLFVLLRRRSTFERKVGHKKRKKKRKNSLKKMSCGGVAAGRNLGRNSDVDCCQPNFRIAKYVKPVNLYIVTKTKRIVMNIEIPSDAMDVIDAECERTGMAKRDFVSRVFRWWGGQSDVIRGSILGHLPESVRQDVARIVLERMAGEASARGGVETSRDDRGSAEVGFARRTGTSAGKVKDPPAGAGSR
jgi:hypothetical protein